MAQEAVVTPVMTKPLADMPGEEALMLTGTPVERSTLLGVQNLFERLEYERGAQR